MCVRVCWIVLTLKESYTVKGCLAYHKTRPTKNNITAFNCF